MRILLDSNIILVSISSRSPYHWVIEKLIQNEFELAVSTEILLEYVGVIEQKMNRQAAEITLDLPENLTNVVHIEPRFRWPLLVDEDDEKFSNCYLAGNAQYIVTHDKGFQQLRKFEFPQFQIINLLEFQKILEAKN